MQAYKFRKYDQDVAQQSWERDSRRYYTAQEVVQRGRERLEGIKQILDDWNNAPYMGDPHDSFAFTMYCDKVSSRRESWQKIFDSCENHIAFWTKIMNDVADKYPNVKW